jgi:hypothetical protein
MLILNSNDEFGFCQWSKGTLTGPGEGGEAGRLKSLAGGLVHYI